VTLLATRCDVDVISVVNKMRCQVTCYASTKPCVCVQRTFVARTCVLFFSNIHVNTLSCAGSLCFADLLLTCVCVF